MSIIIPVGIITAVLDARCGHIDKQWSKPEKIDAPIKNLVHSLEKIDASIKIDVSPNLARGEFGVNHPGKHAKGERVIYSFAFFLFCAITCIFRLCTL